MKKPRPRNHNSWFSKECDEAKQAKNQEHNFLKTTPTPKIDSLTVMLEIAIRENQFRYWYQK